MGLPPVDPNLFSSASGSCGCVGEAIKAIQCAFNDKLPTLLPLLSAGGIYTFLLGAIIKIGMLAVVDYALCLLADLDCGDCDGHPINYCGPKKNGKIYRQLRERSLSHVGDRLLEKPSTYDCCCDVRQVRDLTINTLTALSEKVIAKDPTCGDYLLDTGNLLWYLFTAIGYFKSGKTAISKTAVTFCEFERINAEFNTPDAMLMITEDDVKAFAQNELKINLSSDDLEGEEEVED